jgi:hypothetical protein
LSQIPNVLNNPRSPWCAGPQSVRNFPKSPAEPYEPPCGACGSFTRWCALAGLRALLLSYGRITGRSKRSRLAMTAAVAVVPTGALRRPSKISLRLSLLGESNHNYRRAEDEPRLVARLVARPIGSGSPDFHPLLWRSPPPPLPVTDYFQL